MEDADLEFDWEHKTITQSGMRFAHRLPPSDVYQPPDFLLRDVLDCFDVGRLEVQTVFGLHIDRDS